MPVTPRICGLIPTFNNPRTIAGVVKCLREYVDDVIVIDDSSAEPGRTAVARLGSEGLAVVHHRRTNGGKGAAVKDGLQLAHCLGFTHALQVDADGQHNLDDVPLLLAACVTDPTALILGAPRYDHTAPRGRLIGRRITQFWTNIETGGRVIDDPMCGFRVYPVDVALRTQTPSNRMDFDIEIAVRVAWQGAPIVNIPTKVRYIAATEGGVSHFRMFRDNLRISWAHTRLVNLALYRSSIGRVVRWLRLATHLTS